MSPTHTELSKAIIGRIHEASSDIPRTALEQMSLASQLDLLFLLRGSWGSLGNFGSTQRALRHLVGEDEFWRWPEEAEVKASASATVN